MEKLANFFTPKSVALVGASSNPQKLSYGILENLLQYGYQGEIYPINPKSEEILGLKCYSSISEIPGQVDLAVIAIPTPLIPSVLKECGEKGIQTVTIISGGFKEVGGDGITMEQEILSIAADYQMRLVGPNCVGTVDLYSGLNTTFIKGLPRKGNIAFISQSGAVCGATVDYLLDKGCGFTHFVSLGNEADVTETDMLEFLSQDDRVKALAVYAESIQDGGRFIEVTRQITPHKPVILIKAGRSDAGARAVSSHTGSLAGAQAAYQAAFKQSGVIFADTIEELFALAQGFESQPTPKGRNVALVTNSGGPAALASDSLDAAGMRLADLSTDTQAELRKFLNPAAQVQNPIDMLGGANPAEYESALSLVLADNQVDAAIAILVPQSLINPADVAQAVSNAAAKTEKPVLACFMGGNSLPEALKILDQNRVPVYTFPETAARVLGKMHAYEQRRGKSDEPVVNIDQVDTNKVKTLIASAIDTELGEHDTRGMLETYGIQTIAAEFADSKHNAVSAAIELGFPVAMKIVSPDILHKSDAGGIMLSLQSEIEVQNAYETILENAYTHHPGANIKGVLLEKMAPKGIEVIIGMKRDPNFGPLMMFGSGGIYVELFKDIAFRVAPLTRSDVEEMISETSAGKLLGGIRGMKPSDKTAVIDTILRLAQLALDHPEIMEIEINPLLVLPGSEGAVALDARAILEKK